MCERCDTLALADGLSAAAGELALRRPMTAAELEFGDIPRVQREFDEAEAAVAKAGAPTLKRMVAQLAAEVAPLVKAGDVNGLAEVRTSYVGEMSAALQKGVTAAVRMGRAQVRDQHRQQTGTKLATRPPGKDPRKAKSYLEGRSRIGAQQVADGVRANIVRSASTLVMKGSAPGLDEEALAELIEVEVWAAAERTLVGTALELGREGVGVGRILSLEETAADIEQIVYSAILDDHCCDVCAEADGQVYSDDPDVGDAGTVDDGIAATPNDSCDGTSARCRCIGIVIYSR